MCRGSAVEGSRGSRGVRGVQGVPRGSRTLQRFWGEKHEKIRKTFRSCMARLHGAKNGQKNVPELYGFALRNCIQDFVQEVPVAQMARARRSLPNYLQTGFINFSMAFLPSLK